MLSTKELEKILVKGGFISTEQFEEACSQATKDKKSVEDVLVEKDLISDEHLGQLVANALGVNFINLRHISITDDVLKIIPEVMARQARAIVFSRAPRKLKVALNDPANLPLIHLLQKKTGDKIEIYYATNHDINLALAHYRRGLGEEFEETITKQLQAGAVAAEDLPIVKIVETILAYAYENKASDIHLEPLKTTVVVRFRIDGLLHDVVELPKSIHDLIVSRIKILASLRTDEHRAAQDGHLSFKVPEEEVDVRVSIVPITSGEKVVLRLLSSKVRQFTLGDLGMNNEDLSKVRQAIKRPYGMILATGPTGCGKTTTLYAILKILNRREVNIATIEDPVEYDIQGVNQIQVNPRTNLTFASGLRSILRQDPDIIMVGEIRDRETAGIAINAAMTGHLVLSTLHANDAATTLPRLLDMGIEPFLVASTVNLIISQRLVRRLCPQCVYSYTVKSKDLEEILGQKKTKGLRVYKGKGCQLCHNTGYLDRLGVFELLPVSENIRQLIMARADADEIKTQAQKESMETIFTDAWHKALNGLTSLEEVLRVTHE